MVLKGPDDDGTLYLIGISTKFDDPPGRLMIECPSDPKGHEQTGLKRRCVLKCWWVTRYNKSQIIDYLGTMPSEIAEQAVEYVLTAVAEGKVREGRQ